MLLQLIVTISLIFTSTHAVSSEIFFELDTHLQAQKNIEVIINQNYFNVEVAVAAEDQRVGLGKYLQLEKNAGMLFVYAETAVLSYWMKDMHFPIDIMWIRNNKIVKITPSIPAPPLNTPVTQLTHYTSTEPVDIVLEVNSGIAKQLGINVGDQLTYRARKSF